jgi:hypothetical protein
MFIKSAIIGSLFLTISLLGTVGLFGVPSAGVVNKLCYELTTSQLDVVVHITTCDCRPAKIGQIGLFEIRFNDAIVTVSERSGAEIVWQSSSDWDIQDTAIADFNRDGEQELAIAFERRGGNIAPWGSSRTYEEILGYNLGDANEVTSHLFLYGIRDGIWKLLWGSSPVDVPIRQLVPIDADGDAKQELVVLEQEHGQLNIALWEWGGWGFDLMQRIEKINDSMGTTGEYRHQF